MMVWPVTFCRRKAWTGSPTIWQPACLRNGGFCTLGVSVGKKFDGDPQYAAIVDDKLYLFLNEEIFRAFQKDETEAIDKAEQNWKKIRSAAAKDL